MVCICRQDEVNNFQLNKLFNFSQLDQLKDLTFENFKPQGQPGINQNQAASIETAFSNAMRYAKTQKGWLLLKGKYGTGKTHLAAAIANFSLSVNIQPLFITVPDLLDSLRFSYNNPGTTFEERFEEIRNCPLLILDDFGTQNATPWAQEKLFQIINYRYINKLPLVVTTNLELNDIEERILSRLKDSELVTVIIINAPDYRRKRDDDRHSELSSLHLLKSKTFGNFDLRKNEDLSAKQENDIEKAFKGAENFAKKPKGWIVLMGPSGIGKTHLAAAIANYQGVDDTLPVFVMLPDLLDHLRATFAPNSTVTYDRRFEEIKNSPLLILDDLGTQSMTPWAKEKIYQLFNYRYNAKLPTVFTTTESLDDMDSRIRTRLRDSRLCKNFACSAPEYTGK